MRLTNLIEHVATWIEIAGVGTMLLGIVLAGLLALRDLRREGADSYVGLRHRIGRAILLGLELLVAADIIRTVSEIPTLERVVVLAGIVAIRTFLSFALEIELTGRAPWACSKPGGSDRASRDPDR